MKNKLAAPALTSDDRQEDVSPPPLDFEGCVNMLGGDRVMLQGLLLEFSGLLDIQLKAITAALAAANADVISQIAHSIKGGAAVFSAHSLMNAAAVVEELGKSGDLPKSADGFPILVREVTRLCCYCKELPHSDA